MRSLSMSLGDPLTSMMLSWRFPVSAGEHSVMAELPALEVRHGAASGFVALAALALLAALLSLVRSDHPQPDAGTHLPGLGRDHGYAGIACSEPIHAALRERIVRANDLTEKIKNE